MKLKQKIELLKQLETGVISIKTLKEQLSNSGIIIYKVLPAKERLFHLTGANKLMNQKEINKVTENLKCVLYLPDNGRDEKLL